jgi:hypothetical protein
LTLNDKIVAVVHRGIEIIDAGGLAIERDLEALSQDSATDTFFA